MNVNHRALPRARDKGLVSKKVADEMLVYDRRSDKAHCLNSTAALVWSHCDGQTTIADISRMLSRELETPVAEEVVCFALEQLRKSNLLVESGARPPQADHVTRRVLMQSLAIGAFAVPLVTSIVAPTAAAAASCLPVTAPCTADSECCSNNCADNGRGTLNCT
jgi:hypothetical protein